MPTGCAQDRPATPPASLLPTANDSDGGREAVALACQPMMESKLASASRDFVMADVVIFGASMTAQLAYTYLKQDSNHRVVGFTVDAAYATAAHFDGLPLVPWERIEEAFPVKIGL